MTFQVTVKPPVSHHPKCEDSAVAYGRWTLTCVASVSVPFRGKQQEREPKTVKPPVCKRPSKMRRFSSRLRQVDDSLRSKRFPAVSGQRTRARAKDRTKNGAKPRCGQNRKSHSSSSLGLSLLRTHTETPATQPIRGRLREVVANLPTGVPS